MCAQVEVCNLSTRPELNGCPAHVDALDDAKGRYRITIQLGQGKTVSARLKASNLRPRRKGGGEKWALDDEEVATKNLPDEQTFEVALTMLLFLCFYFSLLHSQKSHARSHIEAYFYRYMTSLIL